MPVPLLDARQLTVAHGPYLALKGVDFSVSEGEIVAIVGPNGGGKTTLLETFAGLNNPRSGDLIFLGRAIARLSPLQRRKMGLMLIPQEGNLFPAMSVRDNLQLGAFFGSKDTTSELLRHVFHAFPRLEGRISQVAGTMSGGEQKMLAIGIGIVSDARVLMIDELSLGLAPKVVASILAILRDFRDRTGITIILSEQSIKALEVADRVYGLDAGEIVFTENAREMNRELVKALYMGA
ncbi:MAG: ABC transporter ATP-binding protein [Bacillota bacterium]